MTETSSSASTIKNSINSGPRNLNLLSPQRPPSLAQSILFNFESAEDRKLRRTKLIDKRKVFLNFLPEVKHHSSIDIRDLLGSFYFPDSASLQVTESEIRGYLAQNESIIQMNTDKEHLLQMMRYSASRIRSYHETFKNKGTFMMKILEEITQNYEKTLKTIIGDYEKVKETLMFVLKQSEIKMRIFEGRNSEDTSPKQLEDSFKLIGNIEENNSTD